VQNSGPVGAEAAIRVRGASGVEVAAVGRELAGMVHVARTDDGDEAVVPVINLEPENRRRRR